MKKQARRKIQAMAEGGHKLASVRQRLVDLIRPGISLLEIEQQAQKWLTEAGGQPAFQLVKGYHWATCININQGVVHGIPGDYQIKDGDLVSIDVGLYYQNYYTDCATSVVAGKITSDQSQFLQAGRNALKQAISACNLGNHVWHISQAIQQGIENQGYSVVTSLTGHGVGEQLHQTPNIPGFTRGNLENSPQLKLGQTLAIEVIYTLGKPEIITESDNWTISTQDGKISALFEETVAVTENGPLVLTRQPS